MTTRKARTEFTIKRLKGFAQAFWRSKRGMLGIIILVISVVVAVGAPLLTPYDPINDMSLGGSAVAPSWYRYFPGGESLSENFYPIKDAELSSPNALAEFDTSAIYSSYDITIKALNTTGSSISVKVTVDGVKNLTTPFTLYGLTGRHTFQANETYKPSGLFAKKQTFKLWNTGDFDRVLTISSPETFIAYYETNPPSTPAGKGTLSLSSLFNGRLVNASLVEIVGAVGNLTFPFRTDLDPGVYIVNATYQNMFLTRLVTITEGQVTKDALVFGEVTSPLQAVIPSVENVFVQYASDVGYTNSPGSFEIIYGKINTLPVNSTVTVSIKKEFYYPYSGPPGRMTPLGSFLLAKLDGVRVQAAIVFQQNWPETISEDLLRYNVTRWYFGIEDKNNPRGTPVDYVAEDFAKRYKLLNWITPDSTLVYDALGAYTPLRMLFPKAGNYTYGIEIKITKLKPSAEAVVYVDKLGLPLLGSSFGLLGTDVKGRDIFTQLLYGTRISLIVGMLSTVLSVVLGLIVGLVAAYLGGIVDEVLMRFTDALLVLPGLPLIIVLMAILSQNQYNLNTMIIVFGVLGWMGFARVVRSQVLSLKERPYVEAAKAIGAGTPYILIRHIMPNVVSLIYVTLALSVPGAIVAEAALSYLGFYDTKNMSWGRMLNDIKIDKWWWTIPPGLAIAILSLSFILLGYALDEILNPKLRMRR